MQEEKASSENCLAEVGSRGRDRGKGGGGPRQHPDQGREEKGEARESDSRKWGASLPPKCSLWERAHQRAVLGGRRRRMSAWRSQHPSSKERQETTLGKRKRKPLGSGSSKRWARPGGVAGGGEEGLARSRVGPQPAPPPPFNPAFPHAVGSQP